MVFGTPLGGITRFVLCILFGLATAVTLLVACGGRAQARKSVTRELEEEEEFEDEEAGEDRGSAWLGMIVHALLSWKARIGRMIRGEGRQRTPLPVMRGPRLEPRFDGDGGAAAYDDDYEDEDAEPAPRRRAAPRAPARRSGSGYMLPSLNLLAAPRATNARLYRANSSTEMLWHSRACCRISEYGGKSSMRVPGRWSRSTNLSPRRH